MLEIFKKLRGNANPTAADLRKALEQIDIAALECSVSDAEAARKAALIAGDAKALDGAEKALSAARTALEHGVIARGELIARIEAAERAEADAALTRERAEVEAFAAETAAAVATRWPALQREMVELLARLSAAEARVQAVNERLAAAGRTDVVAEVEFGRARPRPEVEWAGGKALAATVVLPAIPEWDAPGHGEVRTLPAFYTRPSTAGDYLRDDDRPRPLVFGG